VNPVEVACRPLQGCKAHLQGAAHPPLQVLSKPPDSVGVAVVPDTDISARLHSRVSRTAA